MNRRFFTLGLGGLASASQVPTAAMGQVAAQSAMPDPTALFLANPEISRFRPLRRILFYDDFDNGANGWVELQANHNGNLDDLRPGFNDMRPPQLSSCTFFDVGTHGSLNGTYSLKLATRPKPFHSAVALKRFTYAQPCRVQFEMWFTYKPEQTFNGGAHWDGNASPAEQNFGDFTLNTDICGGVGGPRYMLHNTFTAVIEKNTTFTGPFDTEPYEAAWAHEARWFIRAIDLQGTLSLTPQISPDGLLWCNEGRDPLVMREPGVYSFALRDFGGWLRLHGEVTGEQAKTKVLIYFVLKG